MRTVEDRLLDRIEAAETQNLAARQRRELGWEGSERIDPLVIQSVQELWTIRGVPPSKCPFGGRHPSGSARSHNIRGFALGRAHQRAHPAEGHVRRRTRAVCGRQGDRTRHAAASRHEVRAVKKHRKHFLAGSGEARQTLISAVCSMEFHASIFAAKFLIGENADSKAGPEDLSIQHGIDTFSAEVFFSKISTNHTAGPLRST